MLRLLGGARSAGAPTGEERGGGISCRHAHSLFDIIMSIEEGDVFMLQCSIGWVFISSCRGLDAPGGYTIR